MAITNTAGYTLATTSYTLIGTLPGRARIRCERVSRIAVGQSAPATSTTDYYLVGTDEFEISAFESVNIYAQAETRPDGSDVTPKVRVLIDAPNVRPNLLPIF